MIKALRGWGHAERDSVLVPRSVQQSIPIRRILEGGIWQVGGKFSRTWGFSDINYTVASPDDQTNMFMGYSGILNSLPTIPCTACKYCVDGCPQKINIPGIFKTMNDLTLYNNLEGSKRSYENITKEGGKAGDCIQCGNCEAHCPQKIEIIETLKKAAATLE